MPEYDKNKNPHIVSFRELACGFDEDVISRDGCMHSLCLWWHSGACSFMIAANAYKAGYKAALSDVKDERTRWHKVEEFYGDTE